MRTTPARAILFWLAVSTFVLPFPHRLPAEAAASEWSIAVAGSLMLPLEAVDRAGEKVPLVGFSGVAWMGGDRYVAVMDNGRRLLAFSLRFAADGRPERVWGHDILEVEATHDYEDVVWLPAGESGGGRVLLCEEDGPGVHAFDVANGRATASLEIPAIFRRRRPNRGFESLALDADGRHVWTANEEALLEDGPDASGGTSTVVRLVRLPIDGRPAGRPPLQLAYEVDPPHAFTRILEGPPLSGLTALVAVDDGRLLALERSAGPGIPPFESRIYEVERGGADDVSGIGGRLSERRQGRVAKRLLWRGRIGLNLEGLCLGPELAAGVRSLLAISDNGGLGTPGQLVGFRLTSGGRTTTP